MSEHSKIEFVDLNRSSDYMYITSGNSLGNKPELNFE